jgi:hypothetical protein
MKTKRAPKTQARGTPVVRVVALKNPRTGKTVLVRAAKDGHLGKRDATHLGVKRVSSWVEVEAASWAEATKLVRAKQGKRVTVGRKVAKPAANKEEIRRAA